MVGAVWLVWRGVVEVVWLMGFGWYGVIGVVWLVKCGGAVRLIWWCLWWFRVLVC